MCETEKNKFPSYGTNFKTAFIHKSNPSASRWGVRQLKEDVLQKNGCLEKKYLKEQETQKKVFRGKTGEKSEGS